MSRSTTRATPGGSDRFHEICTVRIDLLGSNPLIWRELEVPTSITLKVLHDVIQAAMGWFDLHLWEFRINGQRYGLPMDEDWGTEPRREAAETKLRDVLKPGKTTIDYIYDFGDNWEHRLTISHVRPGKVDLRYPRYVAGEWNAPPEDCGGIPGFYAALASRADPDNPNHDEMVEWLNDYDPETIDEVSLKIALDRVAPKRNAARTRLGEKN